MTEQSASYRGKVVERCQFRARPGAGDRVGADRAYGQARGNCVRGPLALLGRGRLYGGARHGHGRRPDRLTHDRDVAEQQRRAATGLPVRARGDFPASIECQSSFCIQKKTVISY